MGVEKMAEAIKQELVQRIVRTLLDIHILRLVQTQPMWGYMIKKQAETKFGLKLRHGALYPLLNKLEKNGFMTSQRQPKGGRIRKVYSTTAKGRDYVEAYESILREQIDRQDIK
jgi:DNA-binding PadR family transcriptional regulator